MRRQSMQEGVWINGPDFLKHGFTKEDFSYSVNQFNNLADLFAKTGFAFQEKRGYLIPLLSREHWAAFHPLFKKTLIDVLKHLVMSKSIKFNKFENCDIFCRFLFASQIHDDLGLVSPKEILLMRCGVFAGSFRLEPTVMGQSFNLSYDGQLRPVAFHCVAAYIPTENGNTDTHMAPRVVDAIADSNVSQSSKAKTMAEYVPIMFSRVPGPSGAKVIQQELLVDLIPSIDPPRKTYNLKQKRENVPSQSSGNGQTACMLALFIHSKESASNRELKTQLPGTGLA